MSMEKNRFLKMGLKQRKICILEYSAFELCIYTVKEKKKYIVEMYPLEDSGLHKCKIWEKKI